MEKFRYSMEENPVVYLAEAMHGIYHESIKTLDVSKEGPDHCPVITVKIKLPNGIVFAGKGKNQKEAEQEAALSAIDHFGWLQ